MVQIVIYFIINVIIKDLQYAYLKMKKEETDNIIIDNMVDIMNNNLTDLDVYKISSKLLSCMFSFFFKLLNPNIVETKATGFKPTIDKNKIMKLIGLLLYFIPITKNTISAKDIIAYAILNMPVSFLLFVMTLNKIRADTIIPKVKNILCGFFI